MNPFFTPKPDSSLNHPKPHISFMGMPPPMMGIPGPNIGIPAPIPPNVLIHRTVPLIPVPTLLPHPNVVPLLPILSPIAQIPKKDDSSAHKSTEDHEIALPQSKDVGKISEEVVLASIIPYLADEPISVFVSKIPVEFTNEITQQIFAFCGDVTEFKRPKNEMSGGFKNFAFITFSSYLGFVTSKKILESIITISQDQTSTKKRDEEKMTIKISKKLEQNIEDFQKRRKHLFIEKYMQVNCKESAFEDRKKLEHDLESLFEKAESNRIKNIIAKIDEFCRNNVRINKIYSLTQNKETLTESEKLAVANTIEKLIKVEKDQSFMLESGANILGASLFGAKQSLINEEAENIEDKGKFLTEQIKQFREMEKKREMDRIEKEKRKEMKIGEEKKKLISRETENEYFRISSFAKDFDRKREKKDKELANLKNEEQKRTKKLEISSYFYLFDKETEEKEKENVDDRKLKIKKRIKQVIDEEKQFYKNFIVQNGEIKGFTENEIKELIKQEEDEKANSNLNISFNISSISKEKDPLTANLAQNFIQDAEEKTKKSGMKLLDIEELRKEEEETKKLLESLNSQINDLKTSKLDPHSIWESVPEDQDALFGSEIDWEIVDQYEIVKNIIPYAKKQIKSFLGEEDPLVVEVLEDAIGARSTPQEIIESLKELMLDETENFVKGLWSLFVFNIVRQIRVLELEKLEKQKKEILEK